MDIANKQPQRLFEKLCCTSTCCPGHVAECLLHAAGADDLLKRLEDRVSEFTLTNGLHFIVLERHTSPVVSCHTYADVGSFDEAKHQTGEQGRMWYMVSMVHYMIAGDI